MALLALRDCEVVEAFEADAEGTAGGHAASVLVMVGKDHVRLELFKHATTDDVRSAIARGDRLEVCLHSSRKV